MQHRLVRYAGNVEHRGWSGCRSRSLSSSFKNVRFAIALRPSSRSLRPAARGPHYLLVESTGISEPLPAAEPRLGRRTARTLPLLPSPQKN
jgi:hypothetical protein